MTAEELANRKKGYVVRWIYEQKLNGITPTDKQIQDKYDEIPAAGLASWGQQDDAAAAYERVKPYDPDQN